MSADDMPFDCSFLIMLLYVFCRSARAFRSASAVKLRFSFRHFEGGMPTSRVKKRMKFEQVDKPTSSDIVKSDFFVSASFS